MSISEKIKSRFNIVPKRYGEGLMPPGRYSKDPAAIAWWKKCKDARKMLRVIGNHTVIDSPDHKKLVRTVCEIARTILHLVPKGEDRPRKAIETAEAWCKGQATKEEVKTAAAWAYAAAAAADAAAYAANAAAYAVTAAAYAAWAAADAYAAAADAYAAAAYADAVDVAFSVSDAAAAYTTTRKAKLAEYADIVRKVYGGPPEGFVPPEGE